MVHNERELINVAMFKRNHFHGGAFHKITDDATCQQRAFMQARAVLRNRCALATKSHFTPFAIVESRAGHAFLTVTNRLVTISVYLGYCQAPEQWIQLTVIDVMRILEVFDRAIEVNGTPILYMENGRIGATWGRYRYKGGAALRGDIASQFKALLALCWQAPANLPLPEIDLGLLSGLDGVVCEKSNAFGVRLRFDSGIGVLRNRDFSLEDLRAEMLESLALSLGVYA